jgi:dihydromonapterin reductase/dihydrofolate reductase
MRALVTGCGRRLGFYLCEQLVAAGWQVTGSYRSERPELDRLRGVGVELVQADFAREEEVGAVVTALAAHEDLALIIHNASAFEPQAADPAVQLAQFDQFYRVHMAAPFQLNRALAPPWPASPTPASSTSPTSTSTPRRPSSPPTWPPRREPIRWP